MGDLYVVLFDYLGDGFGEGGLNGRDMLIACSLVCRSKDDNDYIGVEEGW